MRKYSDIKSNLFMIILMALIALSCEDTTSPEDPLPTISSISPSAGDIGREVDVTILGSNFEGATVTSADEEVTVSDVTATATQITATLNISENANPGNVTLSVTTNVGSATVTFALALPGMPMISAITPSSGEIGNDVSVKISGANLFGGVLTLSDSTISVSVLEATDDSIRAQFSLDTDANPGFIDVTITTISGSAIEIFEIEPASLAGITWSAGLDMPTPRFVLSVVQAKGNIFASGGVDTNNVIVKTVEIYDPISGVWTTGPELPVELAGASITAIDDQIYITGGSTDLGRNDALYSLDISANVWTTLNSMPTVRSATGGTSYNGKFYVAGGWDGTSVLNVFESFDTKNNSWTTLANMPSQRESIGLVSIGDKLYAVGGDDGFNFFATTQFYNVKDNTWSTTTAMPTEKTWQMSTKYLGNVLVAGGAVFGDNFFDSIIEVVSINPITNTWTTLTNLPEARDSGGMVVVGNKVYIVGGIFRDDFEFSFPTDILIGELP